jgi:hypothetical protein
MMAIDRLKWLLPALIPLVLVALYMVFRPYPSPHKDIECPVKPFRKFAYLPDKDVTPFSIIPVVLPGPPWQPEIDIPGMQEYHDLFDFQLVLARTNNGETEIWLRNINEAAFLVYRPASQTWEEVSANIGDTNLTVTDLYLTSDGALWGGLWRLQVPPYSMRAPVLGKFNESSRRFEAAAGGLEITLTDERDRIITTPAIVLDKEDVFWLFARRDGIYRYDPKIGATSKQADLPDTRTDAIHPTLSGDGNIYFQRMPTHSRWFLFQFSPVTGEIVPIKVPHESWSNHAGMLVDSKGRFWLGAMGYLDTNGRWRLIHPHPRKNFKESGSGHGWVPPTLIFESSNGILWYAKYLDMGRWGEGIAWYDPDTGTGCLFTNVASFIVEDAGRQLWMVARGKLYRYPLEE